MTSNPETYSSTELLSFEHDALKVPVAPLSEVATRDYPSESLATVAQLATQNLPSDQKSLIQMMVEGKSKSEIATTLNLPLHDVYFLWRDAYRNAKNALSNLIDVDAELRRYTLKRIAGLTSLK